MPCYSRIETAIENAQHLIDALKAEGYTVTASADLETVQGTKGGAMINFRKSGKTYTAGGNTAGLSAIGRKYAEVSVRAFAKRKGYTVTMDSETQRLTLINRRV